jgi:hypothetical protein
MSVLHPRTAARARLRRRSLGGIAGNEIVTLTTSAVLVVLLLAEGFTVLNVRGLLTPHMFIGLVLIPPVLVKLSSTGYRMVRYYAGDSAYRTKGPPALPLRLLAPVLVAATLSVFASGVALLALGHRSDLLLTVHKASFVVWGVVFTVHFVTYLPRLLRVLPDSWGSARRAEIPGAGLRAMLVASSVGAGVALALLLLPAIGGWHGGHRPFG